MRVARHIGAQRALSHRDECFFRRREKTPVFPNDFAFCVLGSIAGARRAMSRERSHSLIRARVGAPDTAFFPSKTQKNACRFPGNAYYDRMKRVNARSVTTNISLTIISRSPRLAF
jgi:hypothetical protein